MEPLQLQLGSSIHSLAKELEELKKLPQLPIEA